MNIKRYTKILACPDCRGEIKEIEINHMLLGFFCEICKLIYPIKEEISILLPKNAKNTVLEYVLIQKIAKEAFNHSLEWLKPYISNTLKILESADSKKSWEWEDEEFWQKEYHKESKASMEKNWNDRIWQREFLVNLLINEMKLTNKIILDVGCGEGQNFRSLLSKHCDDNTLYIGADISMDGLKLNRFRNIHKNSLYILCSANKLPFHRETVEVLCYFGILHHTERKAGTISQDSVIVKNGGYMLFYEPLQRPSFLPDFLRDNKEVSDHEGTIGKNELMAQINNNKELKIIKSKQMHTFFYTGMLRFFRNLMLNNKKIFSLISNLDIIFMKSFGSFIPFFRPGAIMLFVKKIQYSTKGE